jgi:leucyl aminopeptidase
MRVSSTTVAPRDTTADTIAVGLFAGGPIAHGVPADGAGAGALQALVDRGEARASLGHLALTHAAGKRWLLVGLGEAEAFDAERARTAAAAVVG